MEQLLPTLLKQRNTPRICVAASLHCGTGYSPTSGGGAVWAVGYCEVIVAFVYYVTLMLYKLHVTTFANTSPAAV